MELEPLVQEMGFELVDSTWGSETSGWVLRLLIDRVPGGVRLADCEAVSRRVESKLDTFDWVAHAYQLEVSSAGLRRPLKKIEDFERFAGERAILELRRAPEGTAQRVYRARLEGVEEGKITLSEGARRWRVSLDEIAKAHLDPEINI
jgi:ribosome maturation factor RimP